jgi:transcriptional regulator with XRE-family HTH domain
MGTNVRQKPERLAAKLFEIRQKLGLSQNEIAKLLNTKVNGPRISEYEHEVREPNLLTILAYARLIGVPVDVLIADDLRLPETIKMKRKGRLNYLKV